MIKVVKNDVVNDYILIIVGCFMMAIGLSSFLEPKEIVIGGATGLSIIIESVCRNKFGFSLPMWLGNIVINVPLFIISFKVYGFKFIRRTAFAAFFLSVALFIVGFIPRLELDYPIACVMGAVLSGLGLGLIFLSNATTGGSDLAASLLKKVIDIPVSRLMLYIDIMIIVLGFFVFGSIPVFYAIIGAYIIAKVIDAVIEGTGYAKAVYIISNKADMIAAAITSRLNRGATRLYAEGAYTGEKRQIVLCITQVKQITKIKEIVSEIDKTAFVFINDVREVLGDFDKG